MNELTDTYERLVNLLGKRRGTPDFDQFTDSIGKFRLTGCAQEFREKGIQLMFSEKTDCLEYIAFWLGGPPIDDGCFSPFQENFAGNVTSSDCPEQVIKKLGFEPIIMNRGKDRWYLFRLAELDATFIFDTENLKLQVVTVTRLTA